MALGNFFIALVDDTEVFDPAIHARADFELGNARPSWSEKDFWSIECDIVKPQGSIFKGGKSRVFLSEEVDGQVVHSFTGRIVGWPFGGGAATAKITIRCKPRDAEQVEMQALAHIDDDPLRMFSDVSDKRTTETVLAARSALLHWGRDESPPVLVDLLEGDGFIDIGDNFIEGSLTPLEAADYVSKVEVKITAEWQQSLPLVVNIANAMGAGGSFGTISSDIWDDFPQVGDSIGDWTVVQSAVTPQGGPADYSREYTGNGKSNRKMQASTDDDPSTVRFRRCFFDIDLVAVSVLAANRRETLTFTLAWGGQEIAGYEGTTEEVTLEVANMRRDFVTGQDPEWVSGVAVAAGQRCVYDGASWICTVAHITGPSLYNDFDKWDPLLVDWSPSGGQAAHAFFGAPQLLSVNTPNGHNQQVVRIPTPGFQAALYGLRQARAKMVDGMRVLQESFDVPWEDVRDITGRERVRIVDPSLPGGEMTGKVVSISADWISGVATITIAAAPGNGGHEPVVAIPVYPVAPLFTQGIIHASITNQYQDQEAALAAYESPADFDLTKVVEQQLGTSFNVILSPTSATPDLDAAVSLGTLSFDTEKMVDLYA